MAEIASILLYLDIHIRKTKLQMHTNTLGSKLTVYNSRYDQSNKVSKYKANISQKNFLGLDDQCESKKLSVPVHMYITKNGAFEHVSGIIVRIKISPTFLQKMKCINSWACMLRDLLFSV